MSHHRNPKSLLTPSVQVCRGVVNELIKMGRTLSEAKLALADAAHVLQIAFNL